MKTKINYTNAGSVTTVNIQITIDREKENLPSFIRTKELLDNNKWLLKQFINFRAWSADHYCVELFADSLIATGRRLIKNNTSVDSIKFGRRAIFAGNQLKKAYSYTCATDDKVVHQWLARFYPGASSLNFNKKTTSKLEDKLYGLASKRARNKKDMMIKDAWAYITKYINYFWD